MFVLMGNRFNIYEGDWVIISSNQSKNRRNEVHWNLIHLSKWDVIQGQFDQTVDLLL